METTQRPPFSPCSLGIIHEAQKALAEDTGTIPALQELSEYTKIPVEEVRDIMALSKEKGEGL